MSSTNTATDTSDSTSQSSSLSPIIIIIIVVASVALAAGVLVIWYFNFYRKKKRRDGLRPLMLGSSRVEPNPHKNTTRGIPNVSPHVQKHDAPSVVFEVPERESEKYGIHEKVITEDDSLRSPPLVREGPGGLRRTPTRSMTMPMPSRGGEEFSSSEEEYDDDGDDEEAYTGVPQQQHFTHTGEP
ncbi:34141_t:CDS:1 [Racocetra persica]|uniref:34141_t:CDS:1 n=1 Tax=Racocetra persica TaxID=160502 RepID=A0ACA9N893_9GLOM|nr:34141_t:CDS:1 [Racocetra persica]